MMGPSFARDQDWVKCAIAGSTSSMEASNFMCPYGRFGAQGHHGGVLCRTEVTKSEVIQSVPFVEGQFEECVPVVVKNSELARNVPRMAYLDP